MANGGRQSGVVSQRPQTQVLHWQDLFFLQLSISYKSANGNRTPRKHTVYVIFHSSGFYDVLRLLFADARSFQALAAIFDNVTYLLDKLLHSEFQKYEVMAMSVVGGE